MSAELAEIRRYVVSLMQHATKKEIKLLDDIVKAIDAMPEPDSSAVTISQAAYNDMEFAQKCISEWYGIQPPYDFIQVEFVMWCLRRYHVAAAAELGRKGGQSTSEAKRAAVRENGKKGGRPKKTSE